MRLGNVSIMTNLPVSVPVSVPISVPISMPVPDMIFIRPQAYAETVTGVAVANPISNIMIARNMSGSRVESPQSTAIAGPGDIANAVSELYNYLKSRLSKMFSGT